MNLEQRIKELEAELDAQLDKVAELEQTIGYMTARAEGQDKDYQSLKAERDALQAEVTELKCELNLLSSITDKIRVAMGKEISRATRRGNTLQKQVEALETVPMKYRRMQFNAELQDRVAELDKEKNAWAERYLQECIKRETLRVQLRNAEDRIAYLQYFCGEEDKS